MSVFRGRDVVHPKSPSVARRISGCAPVESSEPGTAVPPSDIASTADKATASETVLFLEQRIPISLVFCPTSQPPRPRLPYPQELIVDASHRLCPERLINGGV